MASIVRKLGRSSGAALGLAALSAVYLVAVHGPVYADLVRVWRSQPENSHGMLVPIIGLYLILARRRIDESPVAPFGLPALLAFAAAEVLRLGGVAGESVFVRQLSAATATVAFVLLVVGCPGGRRAWGPLLFVFLAVPLPNALVARLTAPLQQLATTVSAEGLWLLGEPVLRDGTSLVLAATSVSVTEECDGLNMVMGLLMVHAFVAMTAVRSWWAKLLLLVAAIPVALLANVLRIMVTAVAFGYWHGDSVAAWCHDAAGWMMMPFALVLLHGSIWLADWIRHPCLAPAG